jgi:hypothetical protein
MKKVLFILLAVVVAIGSAFAMMMVASETGEVVELTIPTADGASTVRLWVVDLDGVQYLRAGHAEAGWYQQLERATSVEVARNGVSAEYLAVPSIDVREEVGSQMLAKYGWRERYISMLVGGREGSVPIALLPAG